MKRVAFPLVIGIAVLAAALAYVLTADRRGETAEPSAPQYRIAFSARKTLDGRSDIYLIGLDGTGLINLTEGRRNKSSVGPSFSSDGRTILSHSNRHGNWELFTMNVDGSDIRRLTAHNAADSFGAFLPDGSEIVFTSNRDPNRGGKFHLYKMRADGTSIQRLTDHPGEDAHPAFSPDGNKIVLQSSRDGNWEIYVMNADGTDQRRLTNHPARDAYPRFSPDGRRIIFESKRDQDVPQLFEMDADGSNVRQLTFTGKRHALGYPIFSGAPSYSPNGDFITFTSNESPSGWIDIFVMNRLGQNRRQVTDIQMRASYSAVSPVPF